MASDTQFSLQVRKGKTIKNAVAHLIDSYQVHLTEDEVSIQGQLGWAKHKQMTTINLLLLRVVMLSFGRFFPNLIRKLLQKMLITGKKKAPFHFERQLRWENGKWRVIDQLQAESWENVVSAGIGCDQTLIYVVMSRTFQIGQLQPWLDRTEKIKQIAPRQPLKLERNL